MKQITPRLPSAWAEYEKSTADQPRDHVSQSAYDFQARWRFASSFSGIQVDDYKTGEIIDGYQALMKIILVCTAREQLAKTLGFKKYFSLTIIDECLAARIRTELYGDGTTAFAKSLMKGEMSESVGYLDDFWAGRNDNVQTLAFVLRHGIAHGAITPSGTGLTAPSKVAVIQALADAVLADSDQKFSAWVAKRVAPEA